MGLNHKTLVESYRAKHTAEGQGAAKRLLTEAFDPKQGGIRPDEVRLSDLFIECFGYSEFRACRDGDKLANDVMKERLVEEGGAVSTSAFQNISGQVIYTFILDAYNLPDLPVMKMIPTQSTPFKQERVAGISNIGDKAAVRKEGDAYTLAGVSEDYIDTPETVERGYTVPVTKEAIFFDRTGQLLDRCRMVGEYLAINKEKRAVDCLLDINVTTHRYNWRGTVYASYQSSTPWINLKTSNALTDYTSIQNLEILASKMVDPYTNEPILFSPTTVIVAEDLKHNARQVVGAEQYRTNVGGYPTTGNPIVRVSNNTLDNYGVVTSQLIGARMDTASVARTTFWLGDPAKYAKYMENWPMQVRQAPPNNLDEFHRQIVQQFNAFERGAYVVIQPRCMIRSNA